MKVLLLNNPIVWLGKKRPIFPLGLAYVGTYLERLGKYEIRFADLNHYKNHSEELKNILKQSTFDIVGISLRDIVFYSSTQFRFFSEVIKTIRKYLPHCKIICGGAGLGLYADFFISEIKEIDVVICGEGEETIVDLLNKPLNEVDGIIYRKDDRIFCNKDKVIKDFTNPLVPKREWDGLDLSKYHFLNIQTRRGCIFECAHCSDPAVLGAKLRCRDLNNVWEEIDYLISLKISKIFFVDNVFNHPYGYSLKLIEGLKRYRINWSGFFKPNNLNKSYIKKAFKSGCSPFIISAESGSQRIHNYLKTSISVRYISQLSSSISDLPRRTKLFSFMVGLPKENPIDLAKTLFLIIKLLFKKSLIGICPFCITPHTRLAKNIMGKNLNLKDIFPYKKIFYIYYLFIACFDIFERIFLKYKFGIISGRSISK